MSDSTTSKRTQVRDDLGSKSAEKKKNSEQSKLPWFNYMKKDETAPEETREIAFLGYN